MNIEKINKITENVEADIRNIHGGTKYDIDFISNDILYGAKLENEIIGYIHARPALAHILAVYVRKDHKGIGSKLLGKCIDNLKELGINEVHAGVEPGNNEGLSFFRKQGFKEIGVGKSGFTTFTCRL